MTHLDAEGNGEAAAAPLVAGRQWARERGGLGRAGWGGGGLGGGGLGRRRARATGARDWGGGIIGFSDGGLGRGGCGAPAREFDCGGIGRRRQWLLTAPSPWSPPAAPGGGALLVVRQVGICWWPAASVSAGGRWCRSLLVASLFLESHE